MSFKKSCEIEKVIIKKLLRHMSHSKIDNSQKAILKQTQLNL